MFESADWELTAIQAEFNLHDLTVEDARHGHPRPKIEEYGAPLFAVLQIVEVVGDDLNVGEVDVFVGRNYILSIRSRTQQGLLGVRARCEREPELLQHGAGYVLYAITDAVVDRYFPVLDALEVELEQIETRIFAGQNSRAIIESLYGLKQ
jgi:magnesium transporter